MIKRGALPCLLLILAASSYLTGVHSTPVPPRIHEGDEPSDNIAFVTETEKALTKNTIRTRRGISNPCEVDTECEWEKIKPCGCDPCETIKNANEARMIRKQHRKVVAEMKMNRLKRKLHTAVCPPCALAHELELERKPCCNKPHVDLTVVLPSAKANQYPHDSPPLKEYPMVPPPRPTYNNVIETASKAVQMEQFTEPEPAYDDFSEPAYDVPVPMRPQYGPMHPKYEPPAPEYQGFGPSTPWMRSADKPSNEKTLTIEEVLGSGSKRSEKPNES